jgi:2'-5' RNA ligase
METVRAFIAADIGNPIRNKLTGLQNRLKNDGINIRWVKPENIHLTLAFLGDIAVEKIPALKKALDQTLNGTISFDLEVSGLGTFGRRKQPRVVWAGIADNPSLMELQRKTEQALRMAEVGFDERPFSPHLTLGRIKSVKNMNALSRALKKESGVNLGLTRISSADLMQSRLTPDGAEYLLLHRTELGSID